MGFGKVAPAYISLSSLCANTVTKITWKGWGGPVATGRGIACQSAGALDRGEPERTVTFVASNLGTCGGKPAYRTLTRDGEPLNSLGGNGICNFR